ncbi:hypothetical protein BC943DRAFT_340424 [Umbelopsis sp. AD052]|nr:hypothetical protein BC943DRAFT_340424 [Umbelopsis sp. AD052]
MTPKTVKRQLEKKLSLEEKILDQSPWKEKMKELINTAQVCSSTINGVYLVGIIAETYNLQDIYEQEPVVSKSTKKEKAKQPASETTANASNDDEKAGTKRKAKGKKSSEIVHSDSELESNGTDNDSIDEDAPPSKKSKSKKTTAKKTAKAESKSEETIKRLKSYINKCGVRKIWSKELAGCETANSQIARLQSILRDLGVEGRPTVEKCEKIRSERELKAEIDSLSRDNILALEKRATRSVVPPVDAVEDTTEEVEEAKKNDLDLTFLGDQSSDSD